jgi:predicted MPP superfamily phosphohydrolase
MKMLFVADLHYTLKQFDWLMANATNYDPIVIGGDLLDLTSALDADIQILVIEKYLYRLRQQTRVVVCSGNHDLDSRVESSPNTEPGWEEAKRSALSFRTSTAPSMRKYKKPVRSPSLITIAPAHFTVSEQVEYRSHSIRMYPFL